MALDSCPADFRRPRGLHSGCHDTDGPAAHPLARFGCEARRAASWGRGHSGVLFIADQLALVRTGVPLTQEVLADGLQLRQLQPDLLQVAGTPVPDLTQGERVQVPEGDTDQLPARTQVTGQRSEGASEAHAGPGPGRAGPDAGTSPGGRPPHAEAARQAQDSGRVRRQPLLASNSPLCTEARAGRGVTRAVTHEH